ncbi:MAG: glycosyltransferase [Steroidobacteraceae bacterium]
MKILHVVESLERGGLERVVVSLALAQRNAGHEVEVSCLFREGLLAHELREAGVSLRCAGKKAGIDLPALRRLRTHARAMDAGVVHSHNAVSNYYAAAALLGTGIALVNTRHGMGAGSAARKEKLYRLSLRRTAAVAAVCDAARQTFVAEGLAPARMMHVVRNGIELAGFPPDADRRGARVRLGLEAGVYVVGTVGRLNSAKNHARLVDAFALLHAARPASRLVIVGGGHQQAALVKQIAALGLGDVVVLAGDRSDVPALLPAFDVFALSSDTEGYSLALLEAGAACLPCVVSDVGGNAEIVQSEVTGIVVGTPTPAAFAEAFMRLAADDRLRLGMGRAARTWVEVHGSAAAMARAYEQFYEAA